MKCYVPVLFLVTLFTVKIDCSYAQSGDALNFDGFNDYVSLTTNVVVSGSYTKEMWIRPENAGSFPNLLSGTGTALYINNNAPNSMQLSAGHSPAFNEVIDPNPLIPGTWYHVAVTFNAGTGEMILYKDGIEVSTGTAAGYTETVLEIGRFLGGFNYSGDIDEVRIWNKVRTAAEIQSAMNCILPDDEPGLMAYYNFTLDPAHPTLLYDKASFCNPQNGLLNNFALTGGTSNWITPGVSLAGYCSSDPNIHVTGNTFCILNGDVTPVLTDGTNFGEFTATPVVRNFVINNSGFGVLNIASITSSSADFTISSDPATVGVSGSETFTITFNPSGSFGVKTATITIESDDANDGTYTFTVQGDYKGVGQSLQFDGINDYVSLPFSISGSYTKEMWIKPSAQTALFPNLFSGGETALYLNGLTLSAGHSPAFNQVADSDPLSPGTWYHVAVTYDAPSQKMVLYKDGVALDSAVVGFTVDNSLELGRFLGGNLFTGNMDEVRVWNYARNAQEIADHKDCIVNDNEPGLVVYYDFNQGLANDFNFTVTSLRDKHDTCTGLNGQLFGFNLFGTTSNWAEDGATVTSYCGPVQPNIKVVGSGECILDGDVIPSISNGTDFGLYGGTAINRTYWIKNTGTAILTIGMPQLSGADAIYWAIASNPIPVVNPGDSTSFTVRFAPGVVGFKTATISISTNDSDESNYTFAIQGDRQFTVPVSLLTFTADANEKSVRLQWQTTAEINNAGFELVRSDAEQRNWVVLGWIHSKGASGADYTYVDYAPMQGINTYRLKQKDINGTITYSNIVSVAFKGGNNIVKAYPNPFSNYVELIFNDAKMKNSFAVLRNAIGMQIGRYLLTDTRFRINTEKLPSGIYFLSLSNGEVIKLVK